MASLICSLLQLYILVLLIRVILSWFPISPYGTGATVVGVLYAITDPILVPLRRMLPPVRLGGMGLDLSPLAAFFGISMLMRVFCGG
ncbi:MAG: YggT family protein [Actinobacteria bacterium]|nr:MAG: YggT family protein [Actinomycetota bacterium]